MAGEQLRVTQGEERGKRLSVHGDLLIGRAAPDDAGRLYGDQEISRRHAFISRGSDGQLTIEDLGSANGTSVNDERIDGLRTLRIGDVIKVGKTVLQVTDESGAVPETPPVTAPDEVLLVTAGQGAGRRLDIGQELVIGRGASGPGLLGDDHEVSRRHARVFRSPDGRVAIEDLGSANGTYVNEARLAGRRLLEVGDTVRVGGTVLQLARPGRPAVPAAPPAPAAPSPDRDSVGAALASGSVFAGCRVEEVIGHGDMGVVYRAEELALQRPVALKLIRSEHSTEERFRRRFQRESMIAAAIDHPNVIPIFDAGDEGGALFITMRLVEGTDMRALIGAEGRLDPPRAARIVRQVGAALDAAHARGMLHRDVKPSNVLLGREDHVYLTDFGLAKRGASAEGLTRQGSIVARLEYVAPEQILNEPVDARADIYALGCLLYEALTGEPPFARWTDGPAPLAALDAPPPSPLELGPELPRAFEQIVRRAMARDPNDRYTSAADLGRAALDASRGLQKARARSVLATGEAAPAGHQEDAPAGRRDRLRWAVALAGLVLVAIGMVAALNGISTL